MGTLTVIIPTWNDAACLGHALAAATRVGDEIIVVDGGSPDGTADLARASGVRVVTAPKARGIQLHVGALAARGDVFLFLGADARPAPDARDSILAVLDDPAVIGGFLPRGPAGPRDRGRLNRRHPGSSGMFIRAEAYAALGGFRPWAMMHDREFAGRMEAAGRVVDLAAAAHRPRRDRRFGGVAAARFGTWLSARLAAWLSARPGAKA
jgi:glycosyltransferase involved in cell wall biosynthesis